MMKNFQAHPQYETSHYDDYGLDLHEDFSMFLEEAKQAKMKSSSVNLEGSAGQEDKGKNGKKSWKSSLVSWWKSEKKNKPRQEEEEEEEHTKDNNNPQSKSYSSSKRRHGQVSGPIYNNRTKFLDGNKQWISTSGPLTTLFKPTKKKESEVPYMYLHQQNRNHVLQNYGPLYVVT